MKTKLDPGEELEKKQISVYICLVQLEKKRWKKEWQRHHVMD